MTPERGKRFIREGKIYDNELEFLAEDEVNLATSTLTPDLVDPFLPQLPYLILAFQVFL